MKKFSFVKMSGAGNDFIVLDKKNNPPLELNSRIIGILCDRRKGIGADGLITISKSTGYDFAMDYYNSDGSSGSLCGNGARCAIRFAEYAGIVKKEARFISNDTEYSGLVLNETDIRFNLNKPEKLRLNFIISAGSSDFKASFIDTGSPHVVVNIEEAGYNDINSFPVVDIGREIRNADLFAPGGANVNFIKVEPDRVIIRTYERGVEDETLACGTGSAAAAVICCINYSLTPPVKLLTKGGDILTVDFKMEGQSIEALSLNGPAKIVYSGEFSEVLFF